MHKCPICGANNAIVNQCRCDPNNLPTVIFPTYPARPVNGGPFDKAPPKSGTWFYEPKYNGWRALVHAPTGTMFNRHGQRISIAHEFIKAMAILRDRWQTHKEFAWFDCEALERRHNIGRGSLIILDWIDLQYLKPGEHPFLPAGSGYVSLTYLQRRAQLEAVFAEGDLRPQNYRPDQVYLTPKFTADYNLADTQVGVADGNARDLWDTLKALCPGDPATAFYEGIVAKRADSIYPIQLRSASVTFPFWVKHRWSF